MVSSMIYIYLLLAIFSEVVGTSFLKATKGFSVLVPSLISGCGYVSAFYFLSLSLEGIPIGVAYAVWAGLGIVLISLAGYFFWHQPLDLAAVTGMSLIIAGVVIIKLFSKSV